jgi:hypothetical protein
VPAFQHDWVWPAYRSQLTDFAFAPFSPWQRAADGHGSAYPQFYPYYLAAVFCCVALGPVLGLALFVALIVVVTVYATDALLRAIGGKHHPGARVALLLISVANPVWLNAVVAGHLKLVLAGAFATWAIAQAWTPRLRAARAGIALAMTAVQPQIFVLTALVAIGLRLARRWPIGPSARSLAIAATMVVPLLIPLVSPDAVQPLGQLSARYEWQMNQSQALPDALRLTDYLARYAENRLDGTTLGLWYFLPLLAVLGLARAPREAAPLGILAVLILTFTTSFHTPLAPLAAWVFAHYAATTTFREMYNADVLLLIAYLGLGALALRAGATYPRNIAAHAVAAVAVVASLLTLPHVSTGLPTFTVTATTTNIVTEVAHIPGNDRYLVLPAAYPVHPPGVESAGFSPFLFGIGSHPTALSPTPDAALLHTYADIRERSPRAADDLRRLDVVSVSSIPRWRSGIDTLIQPDLASALPRSTVLEPITLSVATQRLAVEPNIDRPGTLDDMRPGANALDVFRSGSPVSLDEFFLSPDPRFGWAKTQLYPLFPSWVYATDLGLFTLRARAELPLPPATILAADAGSGPTARGCARVARLDAHHVVLRCGANSTLMGIPPLVISDARTHATLRTANTTTGSYGTVRLRLSLPSIVVADVTARKGSQLVLREGFDRGWQVWGAYGEHVRVDGYANGWRLNEPVAGRIVLYETLTMPYIVATMASIAALLLASLYAIRKPT